MELNKNLKKGKYTLSSGDILEVFLKDGRKGYFQFLYKDIEYMAGHLIRAFEKIYDENEEVKIESIIQSPIKFHTHTRVF